MALAAASSYAGIARLRRAATALSVDPLEMAGAIGRAGDRARLERMAAALREEGAVWEADLLDGILLTSPRARVAAVNEQLDALSRELEWGRDVPGSAARISIAGALCIVFAAAATSSFSPMLAFDVLAWGAVGTIASLSAGREATKLALSHRKAVDLLVERALAAQERTTILRR